LVRVRALEKAWRNEPSRFAQLLRSLEPIFALDIERESGQSTSLPTDVSDLANRREAARAAKDWNLSDDLRVEIEEQGYEVKDTPEGQKIRRK
jgi:cysteinyl-tRNA synthetase